MKNYVTETHWPTFGHMRATGNFVHIKKVFLNLGPNLASGWEGESMGPTHLRSAPWWKCVYILYLIHQIYTKPYHGVFTFSALYLNKSVNDRDQTAIRKLLGLPPTLEIFVKKWDNILRNKINWLKLIFEEEKNWLKLITFANDNFDIMKARQKVLMGAQLGVPYGHMGCRQHFKKQNKLAQINIWRRKKLAQINYFCKR